MAKSSINKVRNLKQKDETWQIAIFRARTWIETKQGNIYRPWQVMVLEGRLLTIRQESFPEHPTTHDISETLFKAMWRPMFGTGRKRRPKTILFDDAELEKELSPILEGIGIKSQRHNHLPDVHANYKAINSILKRDTELIPSLLSIPKVTIPLLEKVFKAAANYYRVAPWEKIPYEFGLEINYPIDAPARYAVVVGVEGTVFGLAIYNNLKDFRTSREIVGTEESPPDYPFLSFSYENGTYLSFDDLDAIDKYGWDIPNENAYLSLDMYVPNLDILQLPTLDDLLWLAGVLPVLTFLFEKIFDIDELLDGIQRKNTFKIKTLAGEEKVQIIYPVDE
ncbi:MAG: hypothetical protein B5M51_01105 [Anaerolinea sp. 4484_236]|nr:MAG: hypothetical protein B5M51_01105 [Anaerolinea sp. 4484_236]OQY31777.1 MAG: hypothetical protein B6243_08090 [Anaerolineaceae bacterium 4572_5.2]